MFNWFKQIFSDIKLAYLDIKNKKQFISEFRDEQNDPKSMIARMGVVLDPKTHTKMSMITVLDEIFAQYEDERLITNQLNEVAKVFNQYLVYPFGWAEYFYRPSYYRIYDEDMKKDETSVTYLITWQWAPKMINNKKFWLRLSGFITGCLCLLAGIITGIMLIL